MKTLLITLAAAATAATVFTATPAASQVGFYADGPGIDVRIGRDRDHWRDNWRWRDRRHFRDYGFYRGDRCRTVTVRERRWDGTVVVKRRERC
jgi:hypothetical protein